MDVSVRTFKPTTLDGGTLIVGIPHVGIGGTILTDHLLEQLRMDQIACVDSPLFPPFAMIHRGKARFPVRIHADPATRIALLRSEITPPAAWSRPMSSAILEWAQAQGIQRIVVPDGLRVPAARVSSQDETPSLHVWFVATDPATRSQALSAGLREFDQGVLGGVPASLLLEARFRKADILTLLAEFRDPLDDARAAHALALAIPPFVPGLQPELAGLESALNRIEGVVRALREEAEQVASRLPRDARIPIKCV